MASQREEFSGHFITNGGEEFPVQNPVNYDSSTLFLIPTGSEDSDIIRAQADTQATDSMAEARSVIATSGLDAESWRALGEAWADI